MTWSGTASGVADISPKLLRANIRRRREGDFIWLPSGLPHAFRVTGRQPVRFVLLTVPGGLDELNAEVGLPAVHRRLPLEGEARGLQEERALERDRPPIRARGRGSAPAGGQLTCDHALPDPILVT